MAGRARFLFGFGVALLSTALGCAAMSHLVGFHITVIGWLNVVAIGGLVGWYVIDGLFARRDIFALFRREEPILNFALRFWRMVALVGGLLGAAVAASLASPLQSVGGAGGEQADFRTIVILVSVFIAAFGWMYTTFIKEKSDRAANTLQAIHNQFHGDRVVQIYDAMSEMITHARDRFDVQRLEPLPTAAMSVKLRDVPEDMRPEGPLGWTLELATDQFLNALDQVALGVRVGQFDHRTIDLVLRQRFIRHAYIFCDYIKDVTAAEYDDQRQQWRSTVRTWEHFLWLVDRLPVLPTDKIDSSRLVLPPKVVVR